MSEVDNILNEVCPLCGAKIWSIALHYLVCPKVDSIPEHLQGDPARLEALRKGLPPTGKRARRRLPPGSEG